MSDGARDAPPPSTRLAILVPFAIVTLIWGSTWLVIRGQLGVVPPSWSVTYRFLFAGIVMLGYARLRGETVKLDGAGWRFAALIGLFQFCLNFNFVYAAETVITSGLVAVVFALLLLFNALFARVFLGQRLGRQLLVGMTVATCGIALLFLRELRSDVHGPAQVATGIVVALLATAAASVSNVLQATETARRYPMMPTLGVAMLIGAGIDATFAFATTGPPVFDWRWSYLAATLYLGVFASAIAFTLYFRVIRVIGPAKAAYSSVLVPVIAMTLSTVFEGYRWSWLAAAGAVLVLGGLVVALRARRPAR